MAISFLPSQIGVKSQTPLSWNADPRKLLLGDFALCFSKRNFILGIFLPLRFGKAADPFDELYPSWVNLKAIALHSILVVAQLGFIISLPFFVVFPLFWFLGYVVVFFIFNAGVSRLLNGTKLKLEPSDYILPDTKHNSEYWIYMNGVSVGRDWLQSNIDRLSLTFGRRVYGIHNPTDGIIFDMIQCLVQRNFSYSTEDVRQAYASIKEALFDEKNTKVVFLLHSQGGIEGSLIIDWLLAEVPREHLRRLEVYTFGNAASHFNNPRYADTPTGSYPYARKTDERSLKSISWIEHYANSGDFVSQIGVLRKAGTRNRYMGRLFVSPYSGHLLNQHYLHQMFPLGLDKKCMDSNEFMEMEVDLSASDDAGEREGPSESITCSPGVSGAEATVVGDINSPISPLHLSSPVNTFSPTTQIEEESGRVLKVKNFSRLWLYRNGGSPPSDSLRRVFTA